MALRITEDASGKLVTGFVSACRHKNTETLSEPTNKRRRQPARGETQLQTHPVGKLRIVQTELRKPSNAKANAQSMSDKRRGHDIHVSRPNGALRKKRRKVVVEKGNFVLEHVLTMYVISVCCWT